jgi:hypothetical protein
METNTSIVFPTKIPVIKNRCWNFWGSGLTVVSPFSLSRTFKWVIPHMFTQDVHWIFLWLFCLGCLLKSFSELDQTDFWVTVSSGNATNELSHFTDKGFLLKLINSKEPFYSFVRPDWPTNFNSSVGQRNFVF